ncbi:MAG: thiamine pyrophosphate-dependent enzyme [Desulfobulbaceae bacterium]|nr:thiamine pyrophosphate-dependent enzyme [Desulfobulbaceae bacterium]
MSVAEELEQAVQKTKNISTTGEHPMENFLRMDRIPHIWCPTCGIGISVNCFAQALERCEIPLDDVVVVSGIGCTGRVAGYVKIDSFHTTHGRAIPFATGMKLANPKLKVVVFSGDGDLMAIGGNHFIHAARRNIDMTVICINNFNYAMTGGQIAPTTPEGAILTTSPYGNFEAPFNLPFLAESVGAVYVARWTALHIHRQTDAMVDALKKPGFSFIEIVAPCPTIYERRNKFGDGLDRLRWYYENSAIKHGEDTVNVGIELRNEIIVGKFVDIERPTFLQSMNKHFKNRLGDQYQEYEG